MAAQMAGHDGDPAFEKEAWLSATMLSWGTTGRVAYVDDELAGFFLYAPPHLVPRSQAFPTSPVSGDAVLLMTGHVAPVHRGGGIARMLVQSAAKDLTQRGVKAIEAFGSNPPKVRPAGRRPREPLADPFGPQRPGTEPAPGVPSGRASSGEAPGTRDDERTHDCVVPAAFFEAVGFTTVRPHHAYPRLRLELRTALSWREDVEAALERILSSVRVPSLSGV